MKREYAVRVIDKGRPGVIYVHATNAYNACAMVAVIADSVFCAVEVK